jgi:hypothetical protein
MSSRKEHSLSIEEIEQIAQGFRDDLQREANRKVRQHDAQGALVALEGIEYIEKFVYTLRTLAGAREQRPVRARDISLSVVRGKR